MTTGSGLVGLDGQPLESVVEPVVQEPLSDADAEKLGEGQTDLNACDELGVPFFFPLDHEQEAVRGKRIPSDMRRHLRKQVKERIKQQRAHWRASVTKGELDALFNNFLLPLQRQVQSQALTVLAVRDVLLDLKLITSEEFEMRVFEKTMELRDKALEKIAHEQNWSPEELDRQRQKIREVAAQQMKEMRARKTVEVPPVPDAEGMSVVV